jgi:hypothetical protein
MVGPVDSWVLAAHADVLQPVRRNILVGSRSFADIQLMVERTYVGENCRPIVDAGFDFLPEEVARRNIDLGRAFAFGPLTRERVVVA